jgi:hypothetical protein
VAEERNQRSRVVRERFSHIRRPCKSHTGLEIIRMGAPILELNIDHPRSSDPRPATNRTDRRHCAPDHRLLAVAATNAFRDPWSEKERHPRRRSGNHSRLRRVFQFAHRLRSQADPLRVEFPETMLLRQSRVARPEKSGARAQMFSRHRARQP